MIKYNLVIVDKDIDDMKTFWKDYKDLTYSNSIYVFITNIKKGNDIINSNPKWFRYDLILKNENNHKVLLIFSKPSGGKKTYNPQKVEGKPYKTKGSLMTNYYRDERKGNKSPVINNGDRHPTSILDSNKIDIYKWLICSYTNEGDEIIMIK